jgi:predicted kinase
MMKLIILNGPSGIGKSTIAQRLHREIPSSVLIEVDEVRRTLMPDYRERREESHRLAYEHTADAVEENLKSGHDVIIDKTILDAQIIDSFVAIGKTHNAEVYEFFLFADKATVQKRADERGYHPGGLLTSERVGELWEKADTLRKQRARAIVIDTTDSSTEDIFEKVREIVLSTQ